MYTDTARQAYISGITNIIPGLVATAIWGLITGIAMIKSGLSVPLAFGMTLLVYAGSAQLTALPLLASGSPLWLIITTSIVINLRFVIYSAAFVNYFAPLKKWQQYCLAYLNTDVGNTAFMQRINENPNAPHPIAFYLGSSSINWLGWQTFSIAGILLANQIPNNLELQFGAMLALLTLCMPSLKYKPGFIGCLIAGICAIATHQLPLKLGLIISILLGMIIAVYIERHNQQHST